MFSAPRSCPRPPRPARRTGPSAPAAAATRPPSTGISHRFRSGQVSCTHSLRTFACSLKCVSMRFRARLADSLDGASMATDSCRRERIGGMSESDYNGTRGSNAKMAHTHIFASPHTYLCSTLQHSDHTTQLSDILLSDRKLICVCSFTFRRICWNCASADKRRVASQQDRVQRE